MEEQIREQMHKAFWDKLEEDVNNNDLIHVNILLREILYKMCELIPNRPDIHRNMHDEFVGEISWDTRIKLINWIEKLQAPIYDQMTNKWKKENENISQFLKRFYEHVLKIKNEVEKYKNPNSHGNNVPTNMKTG